jgi:4-hydroxybenzoate polyprenyltransferase
MALTMLLLRYTVMMPVLNSVGAELQTPLSTFVKLLFSTLLIAGAGYIINDIHDINIDFINRPESMVVGRSISVPVATVVYYSMTLIGLLLGLWAASETGYYKLSLLFVVASGALWYYATRYKRTFLWGNLIVAALTAMVILTTWLFEFYSMVHEPRAYSKAFRVIPLFSQLCLGFALFAFCTTIVREIVKDIEDLAGDTAENCVSLPIKLGIPTTKKVVNIFIICMMALLAIAQYFMYKHGLTEAALYYLVVQFMMYYLIQHVAKAESSEDNKFSTQLAKLVMVAGIVGMESIHLSLWQGWASIG